MMDRDLRVYCQSQGGIVTGTVFHDINRNGIYEPDLGETPFKPRKDENALTISLVDCSPDDSTTCDYEESAMHRDGRRFPLNPDGSGNYSFECQDCYGQYKLQIANLIYWSKYLEDDVFEGEVYLGVNHDDDWATSPLKYGTNRENSEYFLDPDMNGIIRNNFNPNGETECFDMFSDMDTLDPYVQVIDWGIYYASDISPLERGAQSGNVTESPSVLQSKMPTKNPIASPTGSPVQPRKPSFQLRAENWRIRRKPRWKSMKTKVTGLDRWRQNKRRRRRFPIANNLQTGDD